MAELNEELAPFRILTGIEVDILEDGALDQDEDLLGRARRGRGQRALQAPDGGARDDQADAARPSRVPTPTSSGTAPGRILAGKGRPQSTFDAEAVFEACARTGTAVEINSRPERHDPPEPLLSLALSLGCVVVVDTDAHAPGQLEWQRHGCEQAAQVGVPADRVMNTLPLDDFLAWTAGHDG